MPIPKGLKSLISTNNNGLLDGLKRYQWPIDRDEKLNEIKEILSCVAKNGNIAAMNHLIELSDSEGFLPTHSSKEIIRECQDDVLKNKKSTEFICALFPDALTQWKFDGSQYEKVTELKLLSEKLNAGPLPYNRVLVALLTDDNFEKAKDYCLAIAFDHEDPSCLDLFADVVDFRKFALNSEQSKLTWRVMQRFFLARSHVPTIPQYETVTLVPETDLIEERLVFKPLSQRPEVAGVDLSGGVSATPLTSQHFHDSAAGVSSPPQRLSTIAPRTSR